jgi:hypothetical protein
MTDWRDTWDEQGRSHHSRVAATAHFAAAGTVDRTESTFGANPYNDWFPWMRDGRVVGR